MNIPQTIKIGGKVYRVEITDNLTLGKANVSAEIDFAELVIRIHPNAKGIFFTKLFTASLTISDISITVKRRWTNWQMPCIWSSRTIRRCSGSRGSSRRGGKVTGNR